MFPPGNGFPPRTRGQVSIFSTATNTALTTVTAHTGESAIWFKPAWATMHNFLLVGSAGGGGGGNTGASGTNRGGGGGGGAPIGLLGLNVPSIFLPNALRITLGRGGSGGGANTDGTQGGYSYIGIPTLVSNPANPGTALAITGALGGKGATGATGGTGGGAGAASGFNYLISLGGQASGPTPIVWGSQAGANGGTGGGGGAINGGSAGQCPLWGGNGGGSGNSGGGFGVGASPSGHQFPPQTYALGGQNAGDNGAHQPWLGFESGQFFNCTPPGGGAGNATGVGGNGGDAYYGAGGAGAGGGTTGGTGGKGGDAFCIIWSW